MTFIVKTPHRRRGKLGARNGLKKPLLSTFIIVSRAQEVQSRSRQMCPLPTFPLLFVVLYLRHDIVSVFVYLTLEWHKNSNTYIHTLLPTHTYNHKHLLSAQTASSVKASSLAGWAPSLKTIWPMLRMSNIWSECVCVCVCQGEEGKKQSGNQNEAGIINVNSCACLCHCVYSHGMSQMGAKAMRTLC